MRIIAVVFAFIVISMVSDVFAQTSDEKFKYAVSFVVTGGEVRLLEDAEWGDCKVKFIHRNESEVNARSALSSDPIIPSEIEGKAKWYNPFTWFGNNAPAEKPKDSSVEFPKKTTSTTIDFNKLNWNSARYEYTLGEPQIWDLGVFNVDGDGKHEGFSVEMYVASHRHEKAVQDIVKICPGIFGY